MPRNRRGELRNQRESIVQQMPELFRITLLTAAEEIDLARRARSGEQEARHELIRRNLRLVVSLAGRYVGYGLDYDDLIAEGNVGLIRAADMYDPELGYRFSTYATYWIKQAIMRAMDGTSTLIRVPFHLRVKLRKWNKLNPSQPVAPARRIQAALGCTPGTAANVETAMRTLQCLSNRLTDEGFSQIPVAEVADQVDDPRWEGVRRALDTLPGRARHVLLSYYGLTRPHGSGVTLSHLAGELELSRERVRQIKERALQHIREEYRQDDR